MSSKRPVNILMVDDQPAKLLSYETILSELGENLIRANSGNEALAHLLKTEVAVVLVDVCMPELDGFELASMIRHHPRLRSTAIILVSGVLVDDVNRLRGYDSGAVDYVSVPIIPEILRAKVSVFAELFRKTRELEQLNRDLEQRVTDRTSEIVALLEREQSARREAETANRLKDEFLATLSHELRTPLNAITGWAHILKADGLDRATHLKAVETIGRNAQLQTRIISDILDVSAIITGKFRLSLEPVDLVAVIESTLDTLRPAAEAKNIRLIPDFRYQGEWITGDAARLQQVVWNLVSNAIKFAPQEGLISVLLEGDQREVHITVEDNGPGIRPEFMPYIFDRFRQADSSSTRAHHGLGLGLAIVRHLLEMHGGRVQAMNRTDRSGAIFKASLPRRMPSIETVTGRGKTPPILSGTPELLSPPSLKGVRVLVVDDSPDALEVVAAVLERCGAVMALAASAGEALRIIERDRPHVLVADIEMPGEDGYSLLRRLRALPAEKGGRTPAAALTAYASSHDRAKAFEAGFQIHLAKPVQPVELAAAVAELAVTARGLLQPESPSTPAIDPAA